MCNTIVAAPHSSKQRIPVGKTFVVVVLGAFNLLAAETLATSAAAAAGGGRGWIGDVTGPELRVRRRAKPAGLGLGILLGGSATGSDTIGCGSAGALVPSATDPETAVVGRVAFMRPSAACARSIAETDFLEVTSSGTWARSLADTAFATDSDVTISIRSIAHPIFVESAASTPSVPTIDDGCGWMASLSCGLADWVVDAAASVRVIRVLGSASRALAAAGTTSAGALAAGSCGEAIGGLELGAAFSLADGRRPARLVIRAAGCAGAGAVIGCF